MRVLLFGATGMLGSGVLLECLDADDVTDVLAVGRSTSDVKDSKLRQIRLDNLFDYSGLRDELTGFHACFFCLGVSSTGMSEAEYTHLTYSLTLAAATTLAELNPGMTFCYVSGQGTDRSERSRMMWARVKGRTENALLELPLDAYMFRPGFVQPLKGVRSKTPLYRVFYTATHPVFPLLRRAFPGHTTSTSELGRAMLRVAREGYGTRILENRDITKVGAEV